MEGYLRCFVSDKQTQWFKWLPLAEWWYNTSFHTATKMMLDLLHTHLEFIFLKVIPCLLVIISHYLVSYILGKNIPPREYSLSGDTSI